MLKIGITGGIGSGKSMVCRVFETFGIPVFYADAVAKQVMVTDKTLQQGIIATFGEESYTPAGALANKYIANIVFNNPAELKKLNELVHPATFRAFDSWLATIPVHVPYILKEAALLFESGSYQLCDHSVVVIAPLEMKVKRVMQRDAVDEAQVHARIDKQMTDEEKVKLADFTLLNDETVPVILQVLDLHHQFIK